MGDRFDVRLRRAQPADAERVHKVLVETWHATYDAILGLEAARARCDAIYTPEAMHQMLGHGGGWFGVAETCGSVVALTNAQMMPFRRLFLYMLYVHPSHQRLGLSGAMLDWLPEAFPAARSIRLEVLSPNRNAIRFYRRNGFRPIGYDASCHGSGVPGILMEKPIGNSGAGGWADRLTLRLGQTCIFR